ncbi:FG-GAP-like repeat-containing protein (plasmid) [Streptomyces sp. NBC_01281]|uniref:FG-GAP-like repeat-containing protein n=1 Tax=Streptomyces sp. NBC_01281 TaxID=2903811 RepID=UPI002E0D422C|nr:FG-GAP-like repeat-containing protein [Streptomyces sp. NBC_01281]
MLSRRTEASQVFANPSGTFTEERYATAQWARKGDQLVDVDTSLHWDDNGTIQPGATTVGLKFSGGGDAPLATITRDGRGISLTWPTALPEPSIDGDTVTYPGVLPDVDLKLRATPSGYAQLLVVKSAEAAANPELKTITYKMSGDGVDVLTDADGNLSAVNPGGQEMFTAPTPRMWDSSTSTPAARLSAASADDDSTGPAQPADEFEPGHGAQQAAMPVSVTDHGLQLTPDNDLMTGKDTTYPLYIDPYVDGSRYSWTIAYKKYPDSSFFNGAGFGGGTTTARAGYENETNGLARSYFRMNTKNLWSTNKQVVNSTFRIKNTWSWSCTAKPVELWRTAAIGSSTTWNNRPDRREKMATVTDAKGWSSSCPAGNLAFNVTQGAKDAAAGKWNTITFELAASNESDVYGWKKFDAKSAVLSTEYNTVPNAPSGLDTIPSTKNSKGCGDTAPYGLIGNTDIYLTAKGSDPDGGTVKVKFNLWATGHHPNDDPNGIIIVNKTLSVSSGTVAKLKVTKAELTPYLNLASGNFSWKAQNSDASVSSDWTPTQGAPGCRFVFDPTRPSTPPGITSSQFPDGSDGWPTNTGSVRTPGSFALSSGGITDVTNYEYWTDTDATVRTATPGSAGGTVTVPFTPTTSGTNHMYARSLDKAGNKSDIADYLFYANGPKTADKPGDVNGDGNADLYGTDKDGTLNRFYGEGDGTVSQASSPASSLSWTGTQITHRGDWTDDGYEDLISLKHDDTASADRLWIHPNTGYGFACSDCAGDDNDQRELSVYDSANNHWQGANQILAIGDVDGPLDVDNDGVDDIPGYPDLLVRQGDLLWLYFGAPDNRLDTDRDPILIGPDSWKDMDLFAPGDTNGDGRVDLGARDRNTGVLYIYRGTGDDGDGLADQATKLQTGSNFTVTGTPLITSPGDADHSGKAFDLWFTRSDNALWKYLDISSGSSTLSKVSDGWDGYQAIS